MPYFAKVVLLRWFCVFITLKSNGFKIDRFYELIKLCKFASRIMNSFSMKNIINKIRQVYPVSDEVLQALQTNLQERYYPKDTYIVQSGVTDRLVYFIEEGIARSVFHHNGQDTTTWFSQEGDVTFGMDSLYYKQPSVESIETLSDCKIYVIHIDKLNALYETYIDIANWGRILHQNVNKELSHMFVERLQLSPKERYEQFNRRYPGLINRVKLKYVAAFLGISIYTLSRVRAIK